MWIIILLLLVPALGWAVLVFDAQRQKVLPLRDREFWRFSLRVTGLLCGLMGAVLLLLVPDLLDRAVLAVPFYLLLIGALWLVGWQSFGIINPQPYPEEDPDDPDVLDRITPHSLLADPRAGRMRSVAWFLVAYPLLFFVATLSLFGGVMILLSMIGGAGVLRARRDFESKLLWLLTICVRHQIPMADELERIAPLQSERYRRLLKLAVKSLRAGEPLSLVLHRHKLVSKSAVCAIRVAETGPHLERTLHRLAQEVSDRQRATSVDRSSSTFVYIASLSMVITLIVSWMMYFIVPKLKEIFNGFGLELPVSTRALISVADLGTAQGAWVLFWLGIMALGTTLLALIQFVGWSGISLPLLMQWFPRRDGPEALRLLAGAARDEVPLSERLQLVSDRPGRPDLGGRYQRLSESLAEGQLLGPSLLKEDLVSPVQSEAIAVAERAGHLEFMLASLADAIHRRQMKRVAFWSELICPILVVGCGAVVAFVVISMFAPLVKMVGELS